MSLVAIALFSYAQNPLPIEISYDAAGNRITRKVLQVSMMAKGGSYSDSTYYIDQMQSVLMKVYPNPTQGKVYVEMQGGDEIGNSKIRLFDSHGRLIHEQEGDGILPYSFLYSSCSTHTGLALNLAGIPTLFIHPYTVQASVWLWNNGITPALIHNSYLLQNL